MVEQGSRSGSVKRAQHLQQGGFSTAARTGYCQEFALDYVDIDTPQSLHLTVIELFFDSYDLENISRSARCRGAYHRWAN
jgi:hypothetical protein